MEWLNKIYEMVTRHYIDGKPMHVTAPDKSGFHVMRNDTFVSSTVDEIQLLFSKKHIVVYGLPTTAVQFDEDGMNILAPPWKILTIQGIFHLFHQDGFH